MARADAEALRIEVVHCPQPGRCERVRLRMQDGATVGDAVRASGLCASHALDEATLRVGVWGRMQPLDARLRDCDRVELYRALQVDPKEARRLRYKRSQRAAST